MCDKLEFNDVVTAMKKQVKDCDDDGIEYIPVSLVKYWLDCMDYVRANCSVEEKDGE